MVGDLDPIFVSQKGHPEIKKIKDYVCRNNAWLCRIFVKP